MVAWSIGWLSNVQQNLPFLKHLLTHVRLQRLLQHSAEACTWTLWKYILLHAIYNISREGEREEGNYCLAARPIRWCEVSPSEYSQGLKIANRGKFIEWQRWQMGGQQLRICVYILCDIVKILSWLQSSRQHCTYSSPLKKQHNLYVNCYLRLYMCTFAIFVYVTVILQKEWDNTCTVHAVTFVSSWIYCLKRTVFINDLSYTRHIP